MSQESSTGSTGTPEPRAARWLSQGFETLAAELEGDPQRTAQTIDFDVVIVVAAEPETQIKRVMQRDRLSEPEARQRLAAQLPIDEKVQRADFVIRTDGPPQDTDRQVREVWELLRR